MRYSEDAGSIRFEGIELRATLPVARIFVFHGVQRDEEDAFLTHRLIPVLNSRAQITRWQPIAEKNPAAVSALHIDTAMGRLGLQPEEFHALLDANLEDMAAGGDVALVMDMIDKHSDQVFEAAALVTGLITERGVCSANADAMAQMFGDLKNAALERRRDG